MDTVTIGNRLVGDGQPCYIVAELGINHNGDLDIAKRLIDAAIASGCDAVKFQKRTINLSYTQEELAKPRESPWGTTTRQQKEGLEFGLREYEQIDSYCRAAGIQWFASCWDIPSVDFIAQFRPPCYKIASACLTDRELLEYTASKERPIMLSTGMSTPEEISYAVELLQPDAYLVLMHTTSTYPSKTEQLNLRCLRWLEEFGHPVGYSGHEVGLATTLAAVAIGACVIERHLTLDRTMYGSDQSASIEPHGFAHLVRDIREIEKAMGDGVKRVYPDELPVKAKLRKVETLLLSDYQSVAPTTLAVTVADVKAHLNVSSTYDDVLIESQIKAATLMLENKTRRAFVTQTRITKADSFDDTRYVHGRKFYPARSPLKSVSTVSYLDDDGTSTTMPSSDYVVSTADQPGYIAESYNATWPTVYAQPNSVTVTYVAGHSTVSSGVPEHVKQAIRMVVGHWYRNREAVMTSGAVPKEIMIGVDALLESEMTEHYA